MYSRPTNAMLDYKLHMMMEIVLLRVKNHDNSDIMLSLFSHHVYLSGELISYDHSLGKFEVMHVNKMVE